MSPSPQLAPPGSSTYNSDTMTVGDGTWDAGRETFLLPNLVGFNFATMRYNGMGNRFLSMTGYQGLVKAHGILASITFLLVVPAAILLMRFYGANPRRAVRSHIWLQILTLLLTTAVFAIGWFQVGPRRSLTNPHHGIGLALFILIWVQVLGGAAMHRIERGRRRYHVPLKAMLHHWMGRAIALLGIAQVPLGLTLYGSPMFLFVLYALWVFLLLVVYFILQWRHERRRSHVAPGNSEYSSEVITEQRPAQSHSGFGKIATAGAAGAGLAALWNRRNKPRRRHSESDLTYTSRSSSSSYIGEKPGRPQERSGWGKRILQVGAVGGGLAAARSLFNRRKAGRDDESEIGPYRPPLGGNTSIGSDSMSRLEQGIPPRPVTPTGGMAAAGGRPSHPLAQPPMTPGANSRVSEEYSYYDDYESSSPSRQGGRHQTFKQAVAAGGTMFAVRQLFKNRRQKKEEDRAEDLRQQRVEQERIARMNSQHRYTGDGTTPPRRPRHNRLASQTASDVSSLIDGRVHGPGMSGPVSGMSSATPIAGGAGAAAASALADRNRIRPVGADPPIASPGPASAAPMPPQMPMASDLPPPVPTHGTDMSSGSELYTTASGRQRHRHHPGAGAAAAAAGGAVLGATTAGRRRRHHQHDGAAANTDSLESPPVSIHVKTQDNGRKVTLRRLTEEEAAAQRAARRAERRGSRRRRNSSLGSSSGGEGLGGATAAAANDRWRRTEQLEAQQQAAIDAQSQPQSITPRPSTANVGSMYPTPPPPGTQTHNIDPQTGLSYAVPPPPPIPASNSISNLGPSLGESVTSPGTETSGPSEYANNRRRRRAERAQARLAREGRGGGGGGNVVDFT
ncbi:hypothetical protein OHC33_000024 [Knufia fluminis]|uniref:Cytochrome b561 domain-containing protein n=1 Tax=Knufia fluminis TaxID=191047 RepID=A0AAN8F746_9EURO|nr:hypothetical protein OHC33_000024 [Knufia fluminis]